MVINVRVVPRASRNLVKRESEKSFKVYLTKPAIEGQANAELVKRLAEYLGVKKYLVNIIKGEKARCKLVRISE
ncbi:MAG: DUF167 domain-containing protein [Candidatus Omnitrophica bacterium]|jgi:hypothetical protein|nr:DUF167 domain-containing protein [Candidatus Omnitrophota bacterium]MDD3987807.1 DUF167 domain-containing protein [Candidatus Omnitrophota bacterium]MDD4981201.1 DUF167 domain-containing protein [Candidatus Omnitrophota bacterium]MDD5664711.1 DUF167 domain-containing protein [Candidatus Omnitrophota bacterium]